MALIKSRYVIDLGLLDFSAEGPAKWGPLSAVLSTLYPKVAVPGWARGQRSRPGSGRASKLSGDEGACFLPTCRPTELTVPCFRRDIYILLHLAFDALLSALGILENLLGSAPPSALGLLAIILGWSMPWIVLASISGTLPPFSYSIVAAEPIYSPGLIIVCCPPRHGDGHVACFGIYIDEKSITHGWRPRQLNKSPFTPPPLPLLLSHIPHRHNMSMAAVALMAVIVACGVMDRATSSGPGPPRELVRAPSLYAR